MTQQIGYPNEVWFAIKTLWESVPKISMRETLEQVAVTMKTKVPSEKVARTRKNNEKWVKKIGRKGSDRGDAKAGRIFEILDHGNVGNNAEKTDSSADISTLKNAADFQVEKLNVYPLNPNVVVSKANRILSKVEDIIQAHRTRTNRLGDIQERIITALEDYMNMDKPDLMSEDFEKDMDRRDSMLRQLFKEVTLLEKMVFTMQAHQKTERESWGIESSGDDRTNEIRKIDSTALDKKLAENRKALADQKETFVRDKIKRIESGEMFNSARADA